MAKIIITGILGTRYLVDSNSKFESGSTPNCVRVTTKDKTLCGFAIRETMTEVMELIKEAEAEAETETTNKKLDLILENQKKIMEALRIR